MVFDCDDDAYQRWLEAYPSGYVINTHRGFNRNYMVLHRAGCWTISRYTAMARKGGFAERDYIKVCAGTESALMEWVRLHGRPDGSFSKRCGHCNP